MPNSPTEMETTAILHQSILDELLPLQPDLSQSPAPAPQPPCPSFQPTWNHSQISQPVGIGFLDGNFAQNQSSAAVHVAPLSPAAALDAALHAAVAAVAAPAPATTSMAPTQGLADAPQPIAMDAWTGASSYAFDAFGKIGTESGPTEAAPPASGACSAVPVPPPREHSELGESSSGSSIVGTPRGAAAPHNSLDSEEAKRADRRRRNREASSRSYYRRKAQTEALARDLRTSRARAASLFKVEGALRRENTRLKRLQWERLVSTRLDATLEILQEGHPGESTPGFISF